MIKNIFVSKILQSFQHSIIQIKGWLNKTWKRQENKDQTSRSHSIECKISSSPKIKQTSNRGTDNSNVKEIHKQTKLVCAIPSVLKAPFAMNHSLSRSDSTVINVHWLRTRVLSIRSGGNHVLLSVFFRFEPAQRHVRERDFLWLTTALSMWIRKRVARLEQRWNNETIGWRIERRHFDIVVGWCAASILIDSFRRRWVFLDVLCG